MDIDSIVVRLLGRDEAAVLADVADGVFDYDVQPELAEEFLGDSRHHLAVALDGQTVVGMASAFHYVHPDKRPQMFLNEAGVAPPYQGRGLGRRLVQTLLTHAATLGCTEAWIATEVDNIAARKAYAAAGGVEDEKPCTVFTFRPERS